MICLCKFYVKKMLSGAIAIRISRVIFLFSHPAFNWTCSNVNVIDDKFGEKCDSIRKYVPGNFENTELSNERVDTGYMSDNIFRRGCL